MADSRHTKSETPIQLLRSVPSCVSQGTKRAQSHTPHRDLPRRCTPGHEHRVRTPIRTHHSLGAPSARRYSASAANSPSTILPIGPGRPA